MEKKGAIKIKKLLIAICLTLVFSFQGLFAVSAFAAEEASPVYHIVKQGDTIDTVAKMYGIDAEALLKDNNLAKSSVIHQGDKLVISKTSAVKLDETSAPVEEAPSKITLDVVNVDIRDVLSSLAVNIGVSILFVDKPVYVTFHIENTAPMKVLELLLQREGLEYIEKDKILIVGKSEDLQKNFFNEMVITKISLNYITAEKLSEQIDKLGLPMKKMNVEGNPKAIWVQSTPAVLSKVREAVNALDIPENADKDINIIPFKLNYIITGNLTSVVDQMEIGVRIITVSTNPKMVWAQGTNESIAKFRNLLKQLDVPDNKPEYDSIIQINLKYITPDRLEPVIGKLGIPAKIIIIEGNDNTIWAMGSIQSLKDLQNIIKQLDVVDNLSNPSQESITQVKLSYMAADKVAAIVQQSGVEVKTFTIAGNPYSIWLQGKDDDIYTATELISNIDIENNRSDLIVFAATLNNISAEQAIQGLGQFNMENVKTITISPKISKSLLVICPKAMESTVRGTIFNLDMEMSKVVNSAEKVKVPVDYSDNQNTLSSRRDLISSLTGVSTGSFRISGNVSRTSTPYYVLWLEDTTGNVKKVMDIIKLIDKPLDSDESSSEGNSTGN